MRGSRVGEASNPGPPFLRLRRGRSASVNIGVDRVGKFSVLSINDVDLEAEFTTRAGVMKSPPAFVKGQCGAAMLFALVEADRARAARDALKGETRNREDVEGVDG